MSILPPNATALELAVEATTDRPVAVEIARLFDPDTCPDAFLPWLADALSVDDWSPAWTAERKREVIRQSVAVHRRKGTKASLRRALDAAGYLGAVITEAQDLPRLGRPYELPGGIVPQVAMDFRTGRYWAATGPTGVPEPAAIDAVMTVDRDGPAWAWGPDGLLVAAAPDTPRIAHDPVTRGRLGLMSERAATNLVLQSGSLGLSPWIGSNVSVADNAGIGIDGQMSACVMTETATTAGRGRVQGISGIVAGTRYTAYTIGRRSTGSRHLVLVHEGSSVFGTPWSVLNMDTGVVTSGGGTNREVGALRLPGGDWLLWMACDAIASGASGLRVGFTDNPTNAFSSYAGDGVSGMVISHVQMEAGPRTSPVFTGASAVTRAADRATIPPGPWWNPAEGSFLVQIAGVPADDQNRVLGGWSGAPFDAGSLYITKGDDNSVTVNSGTGGGVFLQLLPPGGYIGQDLRIAFRVGAGGPVAACLNGGPVLVDLTTTLSLSGVDRLRFGDGPWGSGGGSGGVVRIGEYWGRALDDAELRAVTTAGGDLPVPLVQSRARPLGRGWRLGLRDAHWADYTVEVAQQVTRADVDLLVAILRNTAPARCRLRRVSMAQGVRHVLGRGVWTLGRQVPLGGVFNFEVTNG